MDLDRTLIGGLVVDGTGARAYRADVGRRRGRIEAIGDLAAAPAGERVDVRGRVVCPGFIDMRAAYRGSGRPRAPAPLNRFGRGRRSSRP